MAFEAAHQASGRFLLRIEDIDQARCRPAYEAAILEDLAWLGLEWERPLRRQSEHLATYHAALGALIDMGVLYRCFRTRSQVLQAIGAAPHEAVGSGARGVYAPLPAPDEARLLAQGRPFAWRLSIARALDRLGEAPLGFLEEGEGAGERGLITPDSRAFEDIVVARKDLGVSYHLAVVVDDAAQGVTHVIRGADLFPATGVQRLLQALLGLPTPTYRHHRLILRPDGRRFAKRDTAETLRDLRARGVTPDELLTDLGLPCDGGRDDYSYLS